MRLLFNVLFIAFFLFNIQNSVAQVQKIENSETYKIGLMVEALQKALNTRDEYALQKIQTYGTDTRYYSMIRGWLFQELIVVEGQLGVSKNIHNRKIFQDYSDFLKQAIRLIDLE